MPILQLVGRSANDCLHSDGKVLELLLGLTPVRTINHLVQARVHDGSLFIFLKDPQDQRPHNAHWAKSIRYSWKLELEDDEQLAQGQGHPAKVLNRIYKHFKKSRSPCKRLKSNQGHHWKSFESNQGHPRKRLKLRKGHPCKLWDF